MSDIAARKREFASLPIMQALRTVRCGFELETQSVDGSSYDDLARESEPEFDEEAFSEHVDAMLRDFTRDSHGSEWIGNLLRGRDVNECITMRPERGYVGEAMIAMALAWQESGNGDDAAAARKLSRDALAERLIREAWSLRDIAGELPRGDDSLDRICERAHDWLYANVERSDFYSSGDSESELDINCPRGIEAKHDGSVDGPEFVVAGNGTTAPNFSKLLRSLLDQFDLEVDEKCSFHVHVSVPGIKHSYGAMLQCYMMEYLLRNVHRVPERVRRRWQKDTGFFKPELSQAKYSFVHFHKRCKTWEFRCFGNVNSHRDGMRCLQLAVEALQYAYRVSLGMAQSKFAVEVDWSADVFAGVVSGDGSVDVLAKAMRTQRHVEARDAA